MNKDTENLKPIYSIPENKPQSFMSSFEKMRSINNESRSNYKIERNFGNSNKKGS